jgi:hypothetical protein
MVRLDCEGLARKEVLGVGNGCLPHSALFQAPPCPVMYFRIWIRVYSMSGIELAKHDGIIVDQRWMVQVSSLFSWKASSMKLLNFITQDLWGMALALTLFAARRNAEFLLV